MGQGFAQVIGKSLNFLLKTLHGSSKKSNASEIIFLARLPTKTSTNMSVISFVDAVFTILKFQAFANIKKSSFVKVFCFQFKGWSQPYHQPVLKFLRYGDEKLLI